MSPGKKNAQERVTLGHVRLNSLGDAERLAAAAGELLDALGVASNPGVSQAAQEGVALRGVLAFVQEALPDLRYTTLLDGLKRRADCVLQEQVTAQTRADGRPPVQASEALLRCHAVGCVRFLVQHGQMNKTKARQEVADVLRKSGRSVAPSAVKNWETRWVPAQEISPEFGPVMRAASPSVTVETVQDTLAEAYQSRGGDPVRMVANVLRAVLGVR